MIAVCVSYQHVAERSADDGSATDGRGPAEGGREGPRACAARRGELRLAQCEDVTSAARSGRAAPPGLAMVAAAMARMERGTMAAAKLGNVKDAPAAAPGAQSTAEGSSGAWDLCGSIRKHVRAQLEKAVEDGIVQSLGKHEDRPLGETLLSDITVVQMLRSYVAAMECLIAANSYVSSGTYMIDARRLMVALRTNALHILLSMSAPQAAFARSGKLMKHAPRTRTLAQDDANRDAFDRALRCTDGWVSENPAGKAANARDLQCPKCYSSENVSFRAMQDRSGDEGMTYYVVCRNCHNISRI